MARVDPDYVPGRKTAESTAKMSVAHGKYPWTAWLGTPWERWWIIGQEHDFPGVKLDSFVQAARNAALRRRLRVEIEKVDERTVALRVLGERD